MTTWVKGWVNTLFGCYVNIKSLQEEEFFRTLSGK